MKRCLAFLCAVVLCATTLTACNNENQKPSTSQPTQSGEANKEEEPFAFDRQSGFYDEPFTLTIYHPNPEAKIYYTTDGSTPDETDTLYEEAGIELKNRTSKKNNLSAEMDISVDNNYFVSQVKKANVIRAVAVLPDGTKSEVINGTFFVGIDREEEYGDVPIVSILTEKENLFDYETGIYVLGKTHDDWLAEDPNNKWVDAWAQKGNYTNRGREWERPANVEFITADGSEGFTQDMGLRIMGGASRFNNQKSLRLIARDEYGKKNVKYPLIPDNMMSDGSGEVTKYKSFVLRNGGNDCDYTKIRDPILQSLVSDRSFDTLQYRPVVAFIDGEYWGMYTLVEDYTDNYVQNNYEGIDNDNVVIIKNGGIDEGNEDDQKLFDNMYGIVSYTDMSRSYNYNNACERLDMQSFADYCAFNIYIFNEDSFFKCNNWRMWRVRDVDENTPYADGKWRMMAYDTDFSTGIYREGGDTDYDSLKEAIDAGKNGSYPALMLSSLLENDEFKKMFINAMCDLRNINFEPSRVEAAIEEIRPTYEALVPDTFKRFGPQWVANMWSVEEYHSSKIDQFGSFLDGRYDTFMNIIKQNFDFEDACDVTISGGSGTAILNNVSVIDLSEDFTGKYFKEVPITLKAEAEGGKTFVRWECEGCQVSDENSAEATFTLTGNCTIKAVFE